MKYKYNFVLFGGDRLLEKGPLSDLAIFLKKKNFSYLSIIDTIHAKKKVDEKKILKKYLDQNKINYLIVKKLSYLNLKKFVTKKTLGLSINAIWKFPPEIIKLFKGKLYNYHAADLPTERGGANISWRILLNNNNKLSINIHEIKRNFDTGDIVKRANISITKKEILPYQHLKKIRNKEKKFLKQFILDYIAGKKFMKKIQKNEKSYYWPPLKAERDGLINWDWTAKEVVNFIRAFSNPYNGSFSFLNNQKVKILDATFVKSKMRFHPFQNGLIFRFYNNSFYIANRDYYIKISKKNIIGLKKNPIFYLGKRFSND